MSLGKGMILDHSTKQKVNSCSLVEAESIGINNKHSKIVWAKRFIQQQGFEVSDNVIYQDNTSAIKLAENGCESTGSRTIRFNIKVFYVKDLINRNIVQVKYCPF